MPRQLSLQRTFLLLIASTVLAALVPAGVLLDRRLSSELKSRSRDELALAPRILADRSRVILDALLMHAKEVARAPGLAVALRNRDRAVARLLIDSARKAFGDRAVLVDDKGVVWAGPTPTASLLAQLGDRNAHTGLAEDSSGLYSVALAPVEANGRIAGASGVAIALDSAAAVMLAGITHSEVVILGPSGAPAASSVAPEVAAALARAPVHGVRANGVGEVAVGTERYMLARGPLDGGAVVLFVRAASRELAVVPGFRRVMIGTGIAAVTLATLLGALLAPWVVRPVSSLADASDRVAAGDFDAPLHPSRLREVERVARAFEAMRRALRARIDELHSANQTLGDRQARLMSLQAELIHRERQSASSRLVAELAHEIRNPVANLRNCLELVHRRVEGDPEALEFTNMAIVELLRMHELSERMLDLNRPRTASADTSDAVSVAREVAAFARAGLSPQTLAFTIACDGDARVAIGPDMLKQVLLNLAQNAREAMPEGLELQIGIRCPDAMVVIEMLDNGPGIPEELLGRIFDPFFTTKGLAGGIGLGLFLAEGIVRKHGGRIVASNRRDRRGASFLIELPAQVVTAALLRDAGAGA